MAHKFHRVELIRNTKYQASGIKSYVHLLRKYNIGPTKEGPYFVQSKVQHQGKIHGIGGRTHIQRHVLQKHKHHPKPTTPPAESDPGSGTGIAPAPSDPTPSEPSSGNVPAEDSQGDAQYLAKVAIGTPAQNLSLDFDTGSADLWVWSTSLPSSTQSTSGHTIFDPEKSSTFKASSGETWQISYGDGSSASGTVGTDNINLGGLVVEGQAIELADKLSQQFEEGVGDGLLGLAFGSINTVKPKPVATPVENMISQQDIPKSAELFTAHLGNYRATGTEAESFYTFGYIDADTLKATNTAEDAIYYTPIDSSQGFWTFDSTSFSINGKSISRSGNTAIADTGTTLALVDDATVEAIYKAIPGSKYDSSQQGYVFPADTPASKLPSVAFAVGEKLFTVQKDDLAFADAGNGMVYGGIQSRGDNPFDILGDVFLKSIYAIFDQGNSRFGAVQRTDTTDPTTALDSAGS